MPTSGSWVDDFEVDVTQGRTGWKVHHTVGEGKHMTEKGIQTAFTLVHELMRPLRASMRRYTMSRAGSIQYHF